MLVGIPIDFALVLRSRRRELKLAQADLARTIGVSRQWIVAMEQAKPRVEFVLVLKVVEALGLEVSMRRKSDDPPAWTKPITREALARKARVAANRAHARGVPRRKRRVVVGS